MTVIRKMSCKCGSVVFEAEGEPILCGVCYCDDCQAGGRQLEALPGAAPVLDPDGGSDYLTYRDDRFTCVQGKSHLEGYKLREKSPTTRYVAGCCNSAMYLKYKHGHWASTYRSRYIGELPTVEMRTQVQFRDSCLDMPDDAPTYKRFPVRLFRELIKARFLMIVGR